MDQWHHWSDPQNKIFKAILFTPGTFGAAVVNNPMFLSIYGHFLLERIFYSWTIIFFPDAFHWAYTWILGRLYSKYACLNRLVEFLIGSVVTFTSKFANQWLASKSWLCSQIYTFKKLLSYLPVTQYLRLFLFRVLFQSYSSNHLEDYFLTVLVVLLLQWFYYPSA